MRDGQVTSEHVEPGTQGHAIHLRGIATIVISGVWIFQGCSKPPEFAIARVGMRLGEVSDLMRRVVLPPSQAEHNHATAKRIRRGRRGGPSKVCRFVLRGARTPGDAPRTGLEASQTLGFGGKVLGTRFKAPSGTGRPLRRPVKFAAEPLTLSQGTLLRNQAVKKMGFTGRLRYAKQRSAIPLKISELQTAAIPGGETTDLVRFFLVILPIVTIVPTSAAGTRSSCGPPTPIARTVARTRPAPGPTLP